MDIDEKIDLILTILDTKFEQIDRRFDRLEEKNDKDHKLIFEMLDKNEQEHRIIFNKLAQIDEALSNRGIKNKGKHSCKISQLKKVNN